MNGQMAKEGYIYLGVDHESYNPTANRFWPKYFEEYTNSVTRKLENWSVGKKERKCIQITGKCTKLYQ